jgi:hypothetical protein
MMGRNWLKGTAGDAIHAILCAAGQNLRLLLCVFATFCTSIRGSAGNGSGNSGCSRQIHRATMMRRPLGNALDDRPNRETRFFRSDGVERMKSTTNDFYRAAKRRTPRAMRLPLGNRRFNFAPQRPIACRCGVSMG